MESIHKFIQNIKDKIEDRNLEKKVSRDRKATAQESFTPIRAAIIDSESLKFNTPCDNSKIDIYTNKMIDSIKKNGTEIDFYSNNDNLNIKTAGARTYFISSPDEKDKYSTSYQNCTGIVLVGKDKKSGRQISILSHQNPRSFLENKKNQFINDLSEKISDLKSKIEEGSLDAVIFGGGYANVDQYKNSIKFIGEICKKELGHDVTVMTGPNFHSLYSSKDNGTSVYFDTQNRRLFIVRPKHENIAVNESYLANDLEEQSKKWQ